MNKTSKKFTMPEADFKRLVERFEAERLSDYAAKLKALKDAANVKTVRAPDFRRLVESLEAKGLSNEDAKLKASWIYAEQLRRFDSKNPAVIDAMVKGRHFDSLYLRYLQKYFPFRSDAEVRSLAKIIFEAENARKKLENPVFGPKERFKLNSKLSELRTALKQPMLSKQQKDHIEQSIFFIKQKLLDKMLSKGERAFYGFVAENPGALVARNKLTQNGLRIAALMAKDIFNSHMGICGLAGMTLGDCIQEANVGLIDAANRFNPNSRAKFITYAAQRARGQILDALRDKALLLHVPKEILAKIASEEAFAKAKADYYEKIGSAPTKYIKKQANKMLSGLLTAKKALTVVSGSEPVRGYNGKKLELFDSLPHPKANPARQAEINELKEKLSQILSKLPTKGGKFIALRFLSPDSPLTLKEAAEKFGVVESRGWQLQYRGIRELLSLGPKRLEELGFEAPARKGEPTEKEILAISKRLNKLFMERRVMEE